MNAPFFTTAQFRYLPRQAISFAGLEVVINERAKVEKAGNFFFEEPFCKWGVIQENEVVVVAFDEWAISRFLFAVRETDPSKEVSDLVEFEFAKLRFFIEVCSLDGETVAQLALSASRYSREWEGFAASYSIAKNAVGELQGWLVADPLRLACYDLKVPGRGRMGWDGQQFLGQKLVRRPEHFISNSKPEFKIEEYPRKSSAKNEFRITETWPPFAVWWELSNWCLSHKHCCEIDERKIRPSLNQDYIGEGVDFTAGEVSLVDGRAIPCMIALDDEGRPGSIVCLDEACIWEVPCIPAAFAGTALSSEQKKRFPLRVVSRLSTAKRNPKKTIRFMITDEGMILPWADENE